MPKLIIKTISVGEDGGNSTDQVVIRVQSDGGAPARYPLVESNPMNNSTATITFSPAPVYYFTHTCYVSFWDKDEDVFSMSSDDFLGDCYFTPGASSGSKDVYGSDGSHYSFTWQVTADDLPAASGDLLPTDVFNAASAALTAWEQTSEGQEVISITDPQSVSQIVADALVSTAFSDVITMAQNDVRIKAVSLGLMGNVDIFGGINGGFGAVMDVFSTDGTVMYAGGGITEGVDEGFDGGIALGFWYQDVADIGGVYFGGEVMVDDGLGFDGAAFSNASDSGDYRLTEDTDTQKSGNVNSSVLKVSFVSLSMGENDGGDAEEAYFFAGDVGADLPCYQTGDYAYAIRVNQIQCINAESSGNNNDDCQIVWSPDYEYSGLPSGGIDNFIYPMQNSIEMDDDDDSNIHVKHPGTILRFNSTVNIAYFEGKDSEGISELQCNQVSLFDFASNGTPAVGAQHMVKFMNAETSDDATREYQVTLEVVVTP